MSPTQVWSGLRRHPGTRLLAFLGLLGIGLAGLTVTLYLLHFPPQRSHGVLQPWPLLATGIFICGLVLAATIVCLRWIEQRPLATIGIPRPPRLPTYLMGVGLGAIVPASFAFLLWMLSRATIERADLSPRLIFSATVPMTAATILLAAWEEFAFRGYPLQQLIAGTGQWGGAITTGILFGLAHSGNPGANALGFVNTATNGILLAWVVIRTGSLWLACGYHAGWNLMAAQVLGLVDSGTRAPGSLLELHLSGPIWLTGGDYGFEASALAGALEVALLGLILWQVERLPSVPAALPHFAKASRAAS